MHATRVWCVATACEAKRLWRVQKPFLCPVITALTPRGRGKSCGTWAESTRNVNTLRGHGCSVCQCPRTILLFIYYYRRLARLCMEWLFSSRVNSVHVNRTLFVVDFPYSKQFINVSRGTRAQYKPDRRLFFRNFCDRTAGLSPFCELRKRGLLSSSSLSSDLVCVTYLRDSIHHWFSCDVRFIMPRLV